jgi:hypothetical protein
LDVGRPQQGQLARQAPVEAIARQVDSVNAAPKPSRTDMIRKGSMGMYTYRQGDSRARHQDDSVHAQLLPPPLGFEGVVGSRWCQVPLHDKVCLEQEPFVVTALERSVPILSEGAVRLG